MSNSRFYGATRESPLVSPRSSSGCHTHGWSPMPQMGACSRNPSGPVIAHEPLEMKRNLVQLAVVIAALASATGSEAAIVWTGGGSDNDFFNTSNWDLGGYTGPFASTTNEGLAITTDIVLNDATVALPGTLILGAGYTLTATNTTFNTSGSLQGVFRSQGSGSGEVSGTKATFHLIHSTGYLENIGTNIIVTLDPTSVVSINASGSSGINTYSNLLLDPGASVSFANGSGASGGTTKVLADRIINSQTGTTFSIDYYGGNSSVNYNSVAGNGPQGSFVLSGSDLTPFGAPNVDNPNGSFVITAVPEPSALVLPLVGIALLALRRNRSRVA